MNKLTHKIAGILFLFLLFTSCSPEVETIYETEYINPAIYIVKENNNYLYTSKDNFDEAIKGGRNITVIRNGRIRVDDTIYDLSDYYGIKVNYNSADYYNLIKYE